MQEGILAAVEAEPMDFVHGACTVTAGCGSRKAGYYLGPRMSASGLTFRGAPVPFLAAGD